MVKVAVVGAGSYVFGPSVLNQIFREQKLNDVALALVDPDTETTELMAGVARRMAREEGVFVGMSSGAMVWAALEVARSLGPGKRVATIACDTGARYLTTSLFNDAKAGTPPGYQPYSREKVG